LGLGSSILNTSVPTFISNFNNISHISCGTNYSLFIDSGQNLFGFGINTYYNLGFSINSNNFYIPTFILNLNTLIGANVTDQVFLGNGASFSVIYISLPYLCYSKYNIDPTVCSGNGVCQAINSCACNSNYNGTQCNLPVCFGYDSSNSLTCSSNGTCSSPNNCTCNNGYGGTMCNLPTCNGILSTNPLVCNNNGTCVSPNNCQCNSNYGGTNCDIPKCKNIFKNKVMEFYQIIQQFAQEEAPVFHQIIVNVIQIIQDHIVKSQLVME
jgi:hypothetical protein